MNGNLNVGDPAPTAPPDNKTLTVTGQSVFRQRVDFTQPGQVAGWTLENTNGDFVFYPAGNWMSLQTRFRSSGDAVFPKRMSIGDVSSPGTLGINNLTLAVGGKIGARAIHVVSPNVAWPDYVFSHRYRLRPLPEVERFVQANGHLPEVPSAATVRAKGLDLEEMDALLLRKVEELTLYLIALKKENEALKGRISKLEAVN